LELAAPAVPAPVEDPALVIQLVLQRLVDMGVVLVPTGAAPAELQAALGAAVMQVLAPKEPLARVEPPPDDMEVEGAEALAACQKGGEAPGAKAAATAPSQQQQQQQQQLAPGTAGDGAAATATAAARDLVVQALAEAAARLPTGAEAGDYGAQKEAKECSRSDPMGR
jgi:hypothetical protein